MPEKVTSWNLCRLSDALRHKEVSAEETARAYLDEIEAREPEIGAYLSVGAARALEAARAVDAARAAGESLPALAGIPAALKDNICTKGIATTCASKMLEHFVPPYDATVVGKLARQRMILLGKLNMDEFAMGSSTENSYFQITRNPRDASRVPGGSSGGAAAAVAAHEAAYALGSDTGGSIRQPAAFCGVVGMKPTYGRVSRYGLVAFASSLDQIGPLTRTVRDNAVVLGAIAGHDPRDATSANRPAEDFAARIGRGVRGMRIALPKEYYARGVSEEVRGAVLGAAEAFRSLGARIEEAELPSLSYALPAYYVISSAEASSNLARFDGVRYGYRDPERKGGADALYKASRSAGFGAEVKRRIMLGSFVLSAGYYDAYYKKAMQVRTLVARDFSRVLEACDMILSPVAPSVAFRIGEKTGDPIKMYLEDAYTVPVNIAGLPSLAVPCGTDGQGLPIGMQLIGRAFDEARLYQAAYAFEQAQGGDGE